MMLRGHRDSLWWADLPEAEQGQVRSPLPGDRDADVCIVGAGYTGLWTAHALLVADPGLRVMVLEASVAGAGASGRNGGWCSTLLPLGMDAIAARYGRTSALTWQSAVDAALDTIGDVTASEGIDCHFHRGGFLQTASNPGQLARLREQFAHAQSWGRTRQRWVDDPQQLIAAAPALAGVFDPDCAVVQPARLVRGLARAVERRGGVIHEATGATQVVPGMVLTDRGRVRAEAVVLAMEGYTPGRQLLPLVSSMIATDPLEERTWAELGWDDRQTFSDGRRHLFYAQRTADGRIAFGGRGAPYRYRSRIVDPIRPGVAERLHRTMLEQFPTLAGVRITHRWAGVLGVPRDLMPFARFDERSGVGAAGGYTGDGVALSNLAGRTLADLILRRDTDLTRLPLANHPERRWEAEPLRWLGARSVELAALAADRAEHRSSTAGLARAFDAVFPR